MNAYIHNFNHSEISLLCFDLGMKMWWEKWNGYHRRRDVGLWIHQFAPSYVVEVQKIKR